MNAKERSMGGLAPEDQDRYQRVTRPSPLAAKDLIRPDSPWRLPVEKPADPDSLPEEEEE